VSKGKKAKPLVIDNRRYPSTEEVARLFRIPARRVRELKALAAELLEEDKPAE
jgi:hypothetical protein